MILVYSVRHITTGNVENLKTQLFTDNFSKQYTTSISTVRIPLAYVMYAYPLHTQCTYTTSIRNVRTPLAYAMYVPH